MDFLETNEFLDQSLIFQDDQSSVIEDFLQDLIINTETDERVQVEPGVVDQTVHEEEIRHVDEGLMSQNTDIEGNDNNNDTEDMASIFMDWLQSNRESVSAEDLRRVKIKKSTIESAARRLGGGQEAMKKLLKLVLEWVQTSHLRCQRSAVQTPPFQSSDHSSPSFRTTPSPSASQYPFKDESNPNWLFPQSTPWSQPSYVDPLTAYVVPTTLPPSPPPQHQVNQSPMTGLFGDPFSTGSGYAPPVSNSRVQLIDFSQAARPSPAYPPYGPIGLRGGFGSGQDDPRRHGRCNNYNVDGAPRLCGGEKRSEIKSGSSATKEARKKRMARQRLMASVSAASSSTSSTTVASSSGPINATSDFVAGEAYSANTEGREESEVSSTSENY